LDFLDVKKTQYTQERITGWKLLALGDED
jgi:hypothetical protein